MSEAVRPVESVTLKRPLNITQRQHWGQLSCQNQTTGIARTACLPADAFCRFLPLSVPFFPGMQNADETSQPACAQSQEELPLKSKHLYEYQHTQATVEDERKRGRKGERKD